MSSESFGSLDFRVGLARADPSRGPGELFYLLRASIFLKWFPAGTKRPRSPSRSPVKAASTSRQKVVPTRKGGVHL